MWIRKSILESEREYNRTLIENLENEIEIEREFTKKFDSNFTNLYKIATELVHINGRMGEQIKNLEAKNQELQARLDKGMEIPEEEEN